MSSSSNNHRGVSNGASVFFGCHLVSRGTALHIPPHGSLGYPCPHGAAIQLQDTTASQHPLNCVVFYYPVDLMTRNPKMSPSVKCIYGCLVKGLKTVLGLPAYHRLIDPDSRGKISLNSIAAEFTRAVAPNVKKNFPAASRFRVVLVLPVYSYLDHPDRSFKHGVVKEWLSASVGLAAAGGQFLVDHVHVPLKLDLNRPPGPEALVVYLLAALPEQDPRDLAIEPCTQCNLV